jgi:glutathione S-transferase
MIELIQIAYSPYCIVQRRILEFSRHPFKITNIPNGNRSLVWQLTRERYYAVPVIRDGRQVIFETDPDSQVISKYLDDKLGLGLFPAELEGVQSLIWRCIENELEDIGFRLNDIYWRENMPRTEHLMFLRHKERKFGRGCLDKWRQEKKALLAELTRRLLPFDEMLIGGPFLLGDRPRFVDFDLFGILGNFLYSGHYRLPAAHCRLSRWYGRMETIKTSTREKLRTRH